jgi:hypothetical protein
MLLLGEPLFREVALRAHARPPKGRALLGEADARASHWLAYIGIEIKKKPRRSGALISEKFA